MSPMITPLKDEDGNCSIFTDTTSKKSEDSIKTLKLENKVNKLISKISYISQLIKNNEKVLNKDVEQTFRDIQIFQSAIYHEFDLYIMKIVESCHCGFNVLKQNGIISWNRRLKSSQNNVEGLKKNILQLKNWPNNPALQDIEKLVEKEALELSILVEMLKVSHENRKQFTPNYKCIFPKISYRLSELAFQSNAFVRRSCHHRNAHVNDKVFEAVLHIDLKPERTNELRGCTILASGKLVFSDYGNNRLFLYLREGTNVNLERIIPLKGNPFCVTALEGEKIAITFQDLKSILIFDLVLNVVCHEMSFCAPCTGISYWNDKLAVRIEGKGFFLIDPNSGKRTHNIQVDGIHIPCVSLNDNRVYYANWKTGKVSCCEIGGRHLWEFKNVILQSPNGIASDSFGNVFISGYSSNNVVIISRDGLSAKQISPTGEILNRPLGIHFNTARDELLVTSAEGYAVLYSVKN